MIPIMALRNTPLWGWSILVGRRRRHRRCVLAKVKFSSDIDVMRGSIGERVYSNSHVGATVRTRTAPNQPQSALQSASKQRFRSASAAFNQLSVSQLTAWANYGATVKRRDEVTEEVYFLTANMAFMGLASKFLQVNPTGTIPMNPPAGGFGGDTVTLTVSGVDGKITFTASKANAAGVKTELLIQKLASKARRTYEEKYRTASFVAFATGSLSSVVNAEAGIYATAYRFVNTATGQDSDIVQLGIVDLT
jgi:hypothetical protein